MTWRLQKKVCHNDLNSCYHALTSTNLFNILLLQCLAESASLASANKPKNQSDDTLVSFNGTRTCLTWHRKNLV